MIVILLDLAIVGDALAKAEKDKTTSKIAIADGQAAVFYDLFRAARSNVELPRLQNFQYLALTLTNLY